MKGDSTLHFLLQGPGPYCWNLHTSAQGFGKYNFATEGLMVLSWCAWPVCFSLSSLGCKHWLLFQSRRRLLIAPSRAGDFPRSHTTENAESAASCMVNVFSLFHLAQLCNKLLHCPPAPWLSLLRSISTSAFFSFQSFLHIASKIKSSWSETDISIVLRQLQWIFGTYVGQRSNRSQWVNKMRAVCWISHSAKHWQTCTVGSVSNLGVKQTHEKLNNKALSPETLVLHIWLANLTLNLFQPLLTLFSPYLCFTSNSFNCEISTYMPRIRKDFGARTFGPYKHPLKSNYTVHQNSVITQLLSLLCL